MWKHMDALQGAPTVFLKQNSTPEYYDREF